MNHWRPGLFLNFFLIAGALGAWALVHQAPGASAPDTEGQSLRVHLRSRVELFKGSNAWDEVVVDKNLNPKETAIIICDMWDKHWCHKATERCAAMTKQMNAVLAACRTKGVRIIHAPSDCMAFYKDTPQRLKLARVERVKPPKALELTEPPLPVDASDGGCDDENPDREHSVWTRQHPDLTIAEEDAISDNGEEIYSYFKHEGVKNVLLMGVHTNMCVLGRSFAIRQMTRWGMKCVLVRDLTDAMYNPKKSPFVSHAEGTELVIKHIEKYWCPTILSSDLFESSR